MEETTSGSKEQISGFLSISGVIAAVTVFSYIFGNLYIKSYFQFFGIPSSALVFDLQDYISHSLLPLIMAVQVGLWAELIYNNIRGNYFLGFSLTRVDQIREGAQGKLSFAGLLCSIYKDNPSKAVMNIFMLVAVILFSATWVTTIIVRYVSNKPVEGTFAAIVFSFAIGVLYFFLMQITKLLYSQTYKEFGTAGLIGIILSISVVYIGSIGLVANMQAGYDVNRLPKAVIASRTQIPSELTHESGVPNLSKTLRVVTINNNRLYVYLDEQPNAHNEGKAIMVYSIDYASVEFLEYESGIRSPKPE